MIGKTISHYKILDKIGEGGMGEVYLAEDTKLDRKVALKFLPKEFTKDQQAKERFEREAKAAAALNHPNIVTIHEINEYDNQTYIAMEYVGGETLKDLIIKHSKFKIDDRGEVTSPFHMIKKEGKKTLPLHMDLILDITIQICNGLRAAHKEGIVHRDIKPQNILIDKDNRVKILDFGLAKLKGVSQLTRESSTIGTIHYMSPEQAFGKEVDHRTDIWSLGVVLYEISTGQLPFKGDYEQAVIYSILNEKPETVTALRPEIPTDLDQVISKMLSKSPSNRYQNINYVLEDLNKIQDESKLALTKTQLDHVGDTKRPTRNFILPLVIFFLVVIIIGGYFILKQKKEEPVSQSTAQTEKIEETKWKNSIAVLSFADMSPKKDQEYFCDGMAEEIINALTHIKDLRVVARTSAFYFKGKNLDVRQIGEKLNVNTILQGSIRKSGNRVRITGQLINVKDGYHLWSDKFERSINDIFDVQDEISLAIVDKLKLKLLGDTKRRITKQYTKNLDAYNLYLKGKYYWNKRTGTDLYKALECYNKAIGIDDRFAQAFAGIADCYLTLGWYDHLPSKEAYLKVHSVAKKAFEIDNNLVEAHTAFAHVKEEYEWDFEGAEKSYLRAIEINPNYATARHWYGLFLAAIGRLDEAIAEVKMAQQLDPLSLILKTAHAGILFHARKYDQAIKIHEDVLELDPNFLPSRIFLGTPYMAKGMYEKAIAEFKKALDLSKSQSVIVKSYLGSAYTLAGKRTEAYRVINELIELSKKQYVSPTMIANIYVTLDEKDLAFKWYEKGFSIRDHWMIWLKIDPLKDKIRSDPRFKNLLKRIGFKE